MKKKSGLFPQISFIREVEAIASRYPVFSGILITMICISITRNISLILTI